MYEDYALTVEARGPQVGIKDKEKMQNICEVFLKIRRKTRM